MTVINNSTQNIYTGGGHVFGCAAVKSGSSSLAFSYTFGGFVSSLGSGSWGVGKVVDGIALSNIGSKPVDGDKGIALSNIESKPVDAENGIALSNSESDIEDYT